MRFALVLLLLVQDETPAAQERPKDLSTEWDKPELVKEHAKFPGTMRVSFADKGKFVILHDNGGKAVIYEASKWLKEQFFLTQALPCTGSPGYWRDYTGAVTRLGAAKHMWISNKERPVAVSSDGAMVAIARNDHAVQLYDASKPDAPKAEFDAHPRGLTDLFFYGKQYLVTLSVQEVRVWNANKLSDKPKSSNFGNVLKGFATARPDNRYLALNFGRFVHALEVSTMKGLNLDVDFEQAGGQVEFCEDGCFLLCVSPTQTATVFRSGGEWKAVLTLKGDGAKVACATLSPTGTWLAWVDAKGLLHVTHVATGYEVAKVASLGFKTGSMTWHPDGDSIYLCAQDMKSIRIYGKK